VRETFASAPSAAPAQAGLAAPAPLCVDLDGTLLRTDSLHEALVSALRRAPSPPATTVRRVVVLRAEQQPAGRASVRHGVTST